MFFYSKTNQMHNISNLFYFGTTLYMFRTVSPSIIRSLYIEHQVYVIQVLWLLASKQPQNLYDTGLFISPSEISELDCATTKTDTAERGISIGRESLQVFFVLGALAYFQVPPLGGSREEKWRSQ